MGDANCAIAGYENFVVSDFNLKVWFQNEVYRGFHNLIDNLIGKQ